MLGQVAVNAHGVPPSGKAGKAQLQAIVMGPEERHVGERKPGPEHVGGGDLALALRMHPVFDTDTFVAMGVACHVAGGKDPGDRGL
ncbi:hypothetical protein D3C80_1760990 [compost metagenome]